MTTCDVTKDVRTQKTVANKRFFADYESVGRGFESLPAYQ